MATTTKQDQNFKDEVISRTLLEDSIEWIAENMEPQDVFSDSQLKEWATSNGFTDDDAT